MNARDVILLALTRYHRNSPDPHTAAKQTLADYDTARDGRLRDFSVVWTASDGSDVPATELRDVLCGGLVQGVGPHTLLDLNALAASHDCQTTEASA